MKNNQLQILSTIKIAILSIACVAFSFIFLIYVGFYDIISIIIAILAPLIACIINLLITIKNNKNRKKDIPPHKFCTPISLCCAIFTFIISFMWIPSDDETALVLMIISFSLIIITIVETIEYKKISNLPATTTDLNKLVECKELLDMGIITQEEFEEKKKTLLNK